MDTVTRFIREIILFTIVTLIIPFNIYAAIKIESYAGLLDESPVGFPLLATNDRSPLSRYSSNGELNHYAWLDNENSFLSDSLMFIPGNEFVGKKVRLCEIKNTSMECSNEISLTEPNLSSRSSRSTGALGPLWQYQNTFESNLIFNSGTMFDIKTSFDFTGPDYTNEGPLPWYVGARIIDSTTGVDLVFIPPSYPNPGTYADFELTFSIDANLGNATIIRFCSIIFAVETIPTLIIEAEKCIEKMVRDSDIESEQTIYFYPPSPTQFQALFSDVDFKNTTSVVTEEQTKQYILAPRSHSNRSNLLRDYCRAIGDGVEPLSEDELSIFLSSAMFDDTWPKNSGYWTDDVDLTSHWATIIPNGLGVVGGVLSDNNVQFSSAANAYYRGFYICKRK